MNASILGRMLWKEYRTQRGFWLAVVGFYAIAVVAIVLLLPDPSHPTFEELFLTGMIAIFFYVLGSGAMLYAAEQEQGTDQWLKTLPLGASRLFAVKIGWLISSSLVAMACVAVIANLGSKVSGRNDMNLRELCIGFGMTASISILASMLSNQVLKAVAYSFLALLGLLVLSGTSRSDQLVWDSPIAVLICGAAVVGLNRRWLRENSLTWSWKRTSVGRFTLNQALALPVESTTAVRTWRRELTLEWWNARWWFAGLLIGGGLMMFAIPLQELELYRFVHFQVVACLISLACGAGTCSGEQNRSRFLFQGHRGVSSSLLLLSKHVVWITGGLLVMTILGGLSLSGVLQNQPSLGRGLPGSFWIVPFTEGVLTPAMTVKFALSFTYAYEIVFGTALLMYAVGCFCSLVITIPILSLFAAIVGAIVAWVGLLFGYAMEIPWFVSAISPAVALILLTFARGNDWMIDNKSKQSWFRFARWCGLALWTLFSLHAGWRILEVALPNGFEVGNAAWYYLARCAVILVIAVVVAWCFSFLRMTTLGDPQCWLNARTLVASFLITHNLWLGLAVVSWSAYVRHEATPLLTFHERVLNPTRTPDEEIDARDANDAIVAARPPVVPPQDGVQPKFNSEISKTESHELLGELRGDLTPEQHAWVNANQPAIDLFRQAIATGIVPMNEVLSHKTIGKTWGPTGQSYNQLINLVRLKALERECAGDLDEAWEYHIALFRMMKFMVASVAPDAREWLLGWICNLQLNHDFWRWQARKEQTPELLYRAMFDFGKELQDFPLLSNSYKLTAGRAIAWIDSLSMKSEPYPTSVFGRLPWERERAMGLITTIAMLDIDLAKAIESRRSDFGYGTNEDEFSYLIEFRGSQNLILVVNQHRLYSSRLVQVSSFAASSSAPWSSIHAPEVALVMPWQRVATTSLLTNRENEWLFSPFILSPAPILAREVQFWQDTRSWLAHNVYYGYRSEFGEFPSNVGQVWNAPRSKFLVGSPYLAADLRVHSSAEQFPELLERLTGANHAIHGDRWDHASKWPEPEYQIAPTRYSETPLIAPRLEATPR